MAKAIRDDPDVEAAEPTTKKGKSPKATGKKIDADAFLAALNKASNT